MRNYMGNFGMDTGSLQRSTASLPRDANGAFTSVWWMLARKRQIRKCGNLTLEPGEWMDVGRRLCRDGMVWDASGSGRRGPKKGCASGYKSLARYGVTL
jgi:hypothetical protein